MSSKLPENQFVRSKRNPTGPTTKRVVIEELTRTETHEFKRPTPNSSPEEPPGVTAFKKRQAQAQALSNAVVSSPKSTAELDPNYQTIDLPSNFLFYPFKTLSIRTLTVAHQAKLYSAAASNSLRLVVDAISSTLGDGVSAYDLTTNDFYFLMYWQRVNSFIKSPLLIKAVCTDIAHNTKVVEGKLEEDTLFMETVLQNTTLDVVNLELDKLPSSPLEEKYELYPETMRDLIEASEFADGLVETEETRFLAGYAAFLKRQSPEDTLAARMERLKSATPDDIQELDEYIRAVTAYGVTESANLKCKECGALNKVAIPFNAHTFLSDSQRRRLAQ